MARRSFFMFLLLNVLVTFAVVFLSLQLFDRRAPEPTARRDSLIVIITSTPDPNLPPPVTVIVVTATGGASGAAVSSASTPGVPTLDPTLLPPNLGGGTLEGGAGSEVAALPTATDPSGCPTYTLQAGDVPSRIAQQFGVSTDDLLEANDLTEEDAVRLQIGQVLIIPVDGCGLDGTDSAEPTATSTRVVLPTQPPTATLAPTASDAKLEVMGVISPGDITEEGIDIRNVSGDVINIEGWTLSDASGKTFTFPNFQMFGGRRVIVYTRAGDNTPAALFWGLSSAVWGNLEGTVTIRDASGALVLEYKLSSQSVIGSN
ncbi:MAG: lamin tail domain-containing protein [Anaerolineae bacterium]|nr:lamin tail domain-containing protein [Anaerolineae bacterium]